MATHLLQHRGQFVQASVGEVLDLPQIQDHTGRTGLGGKVVQVPGGNQEEDVRQNSIVNQVVKIKVCFLHFVSNFLELFSDMN